jgi:hypothetical protein
MMHDFKRLFQQAPAAAILLLLGGCLILDNSETTHKGVAVAPDTFATSAWVVATLGEPSSKNKTDGDEVWKYVYTEHTDSSGAIFLIFGGSSSNEKTETTFIEFKDGVVVNKWRG